MAASHALLTVAYQLGQTAGIAAGTGVASHVPPTPTDHQLWSAATDGAPLHDSDAMVLAALREQFELGFDRAWGVLG